MLPLVPVVKILKKELGSQGKFGYSKQSGYVYVHERAEKIVEGTIDEFCLIFSSTKAVSLKLGRGVAK